MTTKQGDVALLKEPMVQELLSSNIPARLAYNWKDGTPRAVPMWFYWDGQSVVMWSREKAPKLKALQSGAKVALTIDSNSFPYNVLTVRGTAQLNEDSPAAPEYLSTASRYFGDEQGRAWVDQVSQWGQQLARITVKPEWVGWLDFERRFPSAVPH